MPISQEIRKKYKPTIGIECHVQLKTKTKLFSAVGNDARNAKPNTLISHIDTAMPGALPVLNEKALELAVTAAFALNTEPQKQSYFERKHYFYPDSPAGYQISQLHAPIIVGGWLEIEKNGKNKRIRINRVQLEADAGKTTHPAGANYSLVDLNRSGTPLLEIVSEPDINSAAEAKAYARELYLLMKYAGISEADLYHGNMRFDVNVSISAHPTKLGKRSEVKNLNSFRSVENAVEYEINRQIDLYENGDQVEQETRGWDEDKQKTTSQRTKEEAHDYRYMPEPDIPPVELSEAYIKKIKSQMPRLPGEWRQLLSKSKISPADIEILLDVEGYNPDFGYLSSIEKETDETNKQILSNWIINILVPNYERAILNKMDIKNNLAVLPPVIDLFVKGQISSTSARNMLIEILIKSRETKPPSTYEEVELYAKENGYLQVSDQTTIEEIVDLVIKENPKAAEDLKKGETKVIGFLVGQVMAKSKGQANPQLSQQLIRNQLGL